MTTLINGQPPTVITVVNQPIAVRIVEAPIVLVPSPAVLVTPQATQTFLLTQTPGVGPPGPPGAPGTTWNFVHQQNVPGTLWSVTHPLNGYPNVTTVQNDGTEMFGNVTYVDANTVTISFAFLVSGNAYLS